MQLDGLEGRCSLPSRQQTSQLPEVILILELAVMKGALFMSGAVTTTRLYSAGGPSLEHLGTVLFFNRNLLWVPGEHIDIGSFCPVGVQPASFPGPSIKGGRRVLAAEVQVPLLVATSWPRLAVGTRCKAIRLEVFHSIPNYIELQLYSLESRDVWRVFQAHCNIAYTM